MITQTWSWLLDKDHYYPVCTKLLHIFLKIKQVFLMLMTINPKLFDSYYNLNSNIHNNEKFCFFHDHGPRSASLEDYFGWIISWNV